MSLKPSYERSALVELAKSVGVGPEIVDLIPDPEVLVPHLLRQIPGSAGSELRVEWYRPLFGQLGRDVYFGVGVTFLAPGNIKLGDGCFVDDGVFLDSRRGHGIELGVGVRVCNGAYLVPLEKNGYIKIGDHSYIGARSKIFGHGGVELGHHVLCSPGLTIVPYQHEFQDPDNLIINQGGQTGPVVIGDDVYLGQDVIVLHSMQIGSGSVVGAGSVVNRPVDAYSVAAGVPVRYIRKRYEKRASKA